MCGIISQKQYHKLAENKKSGYKILGEYKDDHGNTALIVADPYGDVSNIYSKDGQQYSTFWGKASKTDAQHEFAKAEMADKGFTLASASLSTRIPGIAELSQDKALSAILTPDVHQETVNSIYTDPASNPLLVQGKTLDEWEKEGELNEQRGPSNHVHPELPTDRQPTEEENAAWVNSLTEDAALVTLLSLPRH